MIVWTLELSQGLTLLPAATVAKLLIRKMVQTSTFTIGMVGMVLLIAPGCLRNFQRRSCASSIFLEHATKEVVVASRIQTSS